MINDGEEVTVIMANNHLTDGRGCSFEAMLLSRPQGPGDCFRLEWDGKELILNGNSSDFVGIKEI